MPEDTREPTFFELLDANQELEALERAEVDAARRQALLGPQPFLKISGEGRRPGLPGLNSSGAPRKAAQMRERSRSLLLVYLAQRKKSSTADDFTTP